MPAASTAGSWTKAPSRYGWSVTAVAARRTTGESEPTNAGRSPASTPKTAAQAAAFAGSASSWESREAPSQLAGSEDA